MLLLKTALAALLGAFSFFTSWSPMTLEEPLRIETYTVMVPAENCTCAAAIGDVEDFSHQACPCQRGGWPFNCEDPTGENGQEATCVFFTDLQATPVDDDDCVCSEHHGGPGDGCCYEYEALVTYRSCCKPPCEDERCCKEDMLIFDDGGCESEGPGAIEVAWGDSATMKSKFWALFCDDAGDFIDYSGIKCDAEGSAYGYDWLAKIKIPYTCGECQ